MTLSKWTATAGRNAFRIWHGDGRTVPGNVGRPVRAVAIYDNRDGGWLTVLLDPDGTERARAVATFVSTRKASAKKQAMARADEIAEMVWPWLHEEP